MIQNYFVFCIQNNFVFLVKLPTVFLWFCQLYFIVIFKSDQRCASFVRPVESVKALLQKSLESSASFCVLFCHIRDIGWWNGWTVIKGTQSRSWICWGGGLKHSWIWERTNTARLNLNQKLKHRFARGSQRKNLEINQNTCTNTDTNTDTNRDANTDTNKDIRIQILLV